MQFAHGEFITHQQFLDFSAALGLLASRGQCFGISEVIMNDLFVEAANQPDVEILDFKQCKDRMEKFHAIISLAYTKMKEDREFQKSYQEYIVMNGGNKVVDHDVIQRLSHDRIEEMVTYSKHGYYKFNKKIYNLYLQKIKEIMKEPEDSLVFAKKEESAEEKNDLIVSAEDKKNLYDFLKEISNVQAEKKVLTNIPKLDPEKFVHVHPAILFQNDWRLLVGCLENLKNAIDNHLDSQATVIYVSIDGSHAISIGYRKGVWYFLDSNNLSPKKDLLITMTSTQDVINQILYARRQLSENIACTIKLVIKNVAFINDIEEVNRQKEMFKNFKHRTFSPNFISRYLEFLRINKSVLPTEFALLVLSYFLSCSVSCLVIGLTLPKVTLVNALLASLLFGITNPIGLGIMIGLFLISTFILHKIIFVPPDILDPKLGINLEDSFTQTQHALNNNVKANLSNTHSHVSDIPYGSFSKNAYVPVPTNRMLKGILDSKDNDRTSISIESDIPEDPRYVPLGQSVL